MKAIPKYHKLYAYYGLIYEMNRYYLVTKDEICETWHVL